MVRPTKETLRRRAGLPSRTDRDAGDDRRHCHFQIACRLPPGNFPAERRQNANRPEHYGDTSDPDNRKFDHLSFALERMSRISWRINCTKPLAIPRIKNTIFR